MQRKFGSMAAVIVWLTFIASPACADREFISLFTVFDENASLHLQANLPAAAACAVRTMNNSRKVI
ncbi:MAG: hypothetical protein JSR71_03800 [Proteobacteria bacterium]|nr:hypothetical protein [Pseudomonadota bacterium]